MSSQVTVEVRIGIWWSHLIYSAEPKEEPVVGHAVNCPGKCNSFCRAQLLHNKQLQASYVVNVDYAVNGY